MIRTLAVAVLILATAGASAYAPSGGGDPPTLATGGFMEIGPRFAVEFPVWWFVSAFFEVGTGLWQHGNDFNHSAQDLFWSFTGYGIVDSFFDLTSIGAEGGVKTIVGVESGIGYLYTPVGSRVFGFVEGGLIPPHTNVGTLRQKATGVASGFAKFADKLKAFFHSTRGKTPQAFHAMFLKQWGGGMGWLQGGLLAGLFALVETGWSAYVPLWEQRTKP